jgi:hypothetical protein
MRLSENIELRKLKVFLTVLFFASFEKTSSSVRTRRSVVLICIQEI